MMSTSPLIFYTTEHCSLCDEAFGWLMQRPKPLGRRLETVDVAMDEQLVERYGERLPVFVLGDAELAWPFDAHLLDTFLSGLE